MIKLSIIICSRSSEVSAAFAANVQATIGVDYELVVIDNHANCYSIFSAYNEGVRRATGDILCFMHEDVTMHTRDWGQKVCRHLQDPGIGALGVVGSHIVPAQGDWRVGYTPYHVLSFVQRVPTFGRQPKYFTKLTRDGLKGSLTDVATLDGVWFCIRREDFASGRLRFDQETFTSFHVYDLDISMQVADLGKRLVVCNDILLEHFSEGNYSSGFYDALMAFQQKWRLRLPVVTGMDVRKEVLRERGDEAVRQLKARIARDAEVVKVRQYWDALQRGVNPAPLTEGQKAIIAFAEFFYMKTAVKYYPSACQLRKQMWAYMNDAMMIRKGLLAWKYFVYRVLHVRPRRTTVKFPEMKYMCNN